VLDDVDDGLENETNGGEGGKERRWEPVVAPIPSRNPAFGWMIAPKYDISLRIDIARGRDETV